MGNELEQMLQLKDYYLEILEKGILYKGKIEENAQKKIKKIIKIIKIIKKKN